MWLLLASSTPVLFSVGPGSRELQAAQLCSTLTPVQLPRNCAIPMPLPHSPVDSERTAPAVQLAQCTGVSMSLPHVML